MCIYGQFICIRLCSNLCSADKGGHRRKDFYSIVRHPSVLCTKEPIVYLFILRKTRLNKRYFCRFLCNITRDYYTLKSHQKTGGLYKLLHKLKPA